MKCSAFILHTSHVSVSLYGLTVLYQYQLSGLVPREHIQYFPQCDTVYRRRGELKTDSSGLSLFALAFTVCMY